MINILKLLLVVFISILASNCFAQSDIMHYDTNLIVDEYQLNTKLFLEKEKNKFELDSVCLDLFDFKVLKSYIKDVEKNCDLKIQKRDELCSENILKIQREHDRIVKSYILRYDKLLEEKNKIKIELVTNKKLSKERIKKYQWIIGTTSVVFASTITFLLVK